MVAVASTIIAAKIVELLQKRSRLTYYVSSFAKFKVEGQDIETHSIVLDNLGKLPATNVMVPHKWLPKMHEVQTEGARYRTEITNDGGTDIVFDRLVPGDRVTIHYLYSPNDNALDMHRPPRYDEGFAEPLNMAQMRQYPK